MTGMRLTICWASAAALIVAGIRGVALTHGAWIPCGGEHFTEPCLSTMGSPRHMPALANLWGLSLVLAVVSGFLLKTRAGRLLGFTAAVLVLLMNAGTDYVVLLAIAGGHHDFPPGTGYPMALALVLAGILVGAGALIDARHGSHAQHPSPSVSTSSI